MNNITIEKADYIISYYRNLLTLQEQKALRHHQSTLKLDDAKEVRLTRLYLKTGWLSDDPLILNYLNEGYIQFILKRAERILKDNPDKVYFNFCPVSISCHEHLRLNNAGFVDMIGIDVIFVWVRVPSSTETRATNLHKHWGGSLRLRPSGS